MLKELFINIPLVEALEKMPSYARFIKYLVTNKQTVSFDHADNVCHCSVVASRMLTEKKKTSEHLLFYVLQGLSTSLGINEI